MMANPPFSVAPRPQPIVISKTYVYKTVDAVRIPLDIYLPEAESPFSSKQNVSQPYPIMVFIHGGGWTGGTKMDYSRPLFKHFLDLQFLVVAVDYRLLPETNFAGQMEDIRDVEMWVRNELPRKMIDQMVAVDVSKVVVVGGSAGAHLALLTPKLWTILPIAILSMYGPTDMHDLPYSGRGLLSTLVIPEPSVQMLEGATTYHAPPTEIPLPTTPADYVKPRGLMSLHLFRRSILAEFILKGLVKDEGGNLSLPAKGCCTKEEIDAISPLHILDTLSSHPPIYHIIGSDDAIFAPDHAHVLHRALRSRGIPSQVVVVPGAKHAFDVWEEVGSEADRRWLKPGVTWVAAWAGRGDGQKGGITGGEVGGVGVGVGTGVGVTVGRGCGCGDMGKLEVMGGGVGGFNGGSGIDGV